MPVTKATPDRKTKVTFNRFMPCVLQPAVFFSREADEMGRGESAKTTNVTLINEVGWRLRGKSSLEEQWESDTAQTPRPGTVASGIFSFYGNRKPTLSGVTFSGRADQSKELYIKRVASGDSWAKSLSADLTSFPAPDSTSYDGLGLYQPTAPMDRVYISSSVHEPDDAVSFTVGTTATKYGSSSIFAYCYFTGPAGKDSVLEGLGQYCIAVGGGGVALLMERGNEPGETDLVWRLRQRFNVGEVKPGDTVGFTVTSDCATGCSGSWSGTKLAIKTQTVHQPGKGFAVVEYITALAANVVEAGLASTYIYTPPNAKGRPVTLAPVRIDARRDHRIVFNAFDTTYPEEGIIEDQPFPIGILATDAKAIVIDTYCDRPSGTGVDFKLYAVDGPTPGVELTGTLTIDDCLGQRYEFTIPSGYPLAANFKAKITLTGPGTKGPTFKKYVVARDPVLENADTSATFEFPKRTTDAGPALPRRVVESVSIQGTSTDQAESASITVTDLTAELPEVRKRTGTPIDIDITNDAGTLVTRLFRGVIQQVTTQDLPSPKTYPADLAWRGELALVSEIRRLNRRLAPTRITLWDTITELPLKVTDAVKLLLEYAGYGPEYVGIPDYPIRILGASAEDTVIEPDTPLGDVIAQLVGDYLGGTFFFCENSGTDGQWRVLIWPRAPYNVVLRFDPNPPGGLKLRHILGAYGTETAENGQVIQTLPMFRQRRMTYDPPEGNMIVVIGGNNKLAGPGGGQLVQTAVNVASFNPLGLAEAHDSYPDKTSPDYLRDCVPIVVRDTTLSTPEAINFVTRRVYDAASSAKETLRFTSLLPFFTDVTDDYQTRVRMPRMGDIVEVKQPDGSWKTFVIASCNPSYRRAGMMRADYELVSTSTMASIAIPRGTLNGAKLTDKIYDQFKMGLGLGGSRYTMSGNAVGGYNRSGFAGLPSATIEPIQDLDPDSATFGQFYFMAGYDPVP